jgi:hypothetical protein
MYAKKCMYMRDLIYATQVIDMEHFICLVYKISYFLTQNETPSPIGNKLT